MMVFYDEMPDMADVGLVNDYLYDNVLLISFLVCC